MADMQVPVRLRGKAGHDVRVLAAGEIGVDDLADEVGAGALIAHAVDGQKTGVEYSLINGQAGGWGQSEE